MILSFSVPLLLAMAPLPAAAPLADGEVVSVQAQYETLSSWEGEWVLEGIDTLTITFENAGNGHVVMERWQTPRGLHSLTLYHRDADRLITTHYCPQGNQPRLAAHASHSNEIAFEFVDITDLDEGESHAHTLTFKPAADGSILRTEVYLKPDGTRSTQDYVMRRKRVP